MQYAKPALSYEQQADQLLARGMTADRDQLIERLRQVSYFRLSGYWYPFRTFDPAGTGQRLDEFEPGTDFAVLWERYVFDRRLRLLMLDAIERIEISVRSQLAYQHAHAFGLFAYATDANALPGARGSDRSTFLQNLQTEVNRSKDTFVKHFKQKYGDRHHHLPVWMAVEIMAFGSILSFYRGSPKDETRLCAVARRVTADGNLRLSIRPTKPGNVSDESAGVHRMMGIACPGTGVSNSEQRVQVAQSKAPAERPDRSPSRRGDMAAPD